MFPIADITNNLHNSLMNITAVQHTYLWSDGSMARIHQNGCHTHAGKVGQLPHIILWRNCFIWCKMSCTRIVWSLAAQTGQIIASGACFPAEKMFRGVRCMPSSTYVDLRRISLAAATPHLASQSHSSTTDETRPTCKKVIQYCCWQPPESPGRILADISVLHCC